MRGRDTSSESANDMGGLIAAGAFRARPCRYGGSAVSFEGPGIVMEKWFQSIGLTWFIHSMDGRPASTCNRMVPHCARGSPGLLHPRNRFAVARCRDLIVHD